MRPHHTLWKMWSLHDLKFDIGGIADIDLFESHVRDAVNYFVRGLYGAAALASVLGEQRLYQDLKLQGDALEGAWP
jgi:hypothetical protein